MFNVRLEYQLANEFFLTSKIDAKYMYRISDAEKGYIEFQVTDLDWAVDLVITMQDKAKVISPPQLIEKVKCRIAKMNMQYKDDI